MPVKAEDAFSNMAYNYTHHFMYVILIAYIISGMLVLMFTQVCNLYMTFLCAYANFVAFTQSSETQRGAVVCSRLCSSTGWVKVVSKSYPVITT